MPHVHTCTEKAAGQVTVHEECQAETKTAVQSTLDPLGVPGRPGVRTESSLLEVVGPVRPLVSQTWLCKMARETE